MDPLRPSAYFFRYLLKFKKYLLLSKTLKPLNIARTYIDTDSHKLKQVKTVIIICQTSNQSATMEQNYCSSKSIF
jgi:hypothetical protein